MTLGFDTLVPEQILDAIECSGLQCTGELLALNSYENRVYRAALDRGEERSFPALFLHVPPVEMLGVEQQARVVRGFLARLL